MTEYARQRTSIALALSAADGIERWEACGLLLPGG